jgi:AcrR family transcriptional regulator
MPSNLSNSIRVAPQQERSSHRLASFLNAAAELFVEVGYDATTMTAIAERSGSSIGALYNYFPDKQAVALTLLGQYAQEMEEQWRREFASLFIERITEILQVRPAYLRLLAAPIRLRRDPAVKRVLRANIANAFRAKNPSLSDERAVVAANVTLEMVRGLKTLYGEAGDKGKDMIVAEFKKALTLYLGSVLGS